MNTTEKVVLGVGVGSAVSIIGVMGYLIHVSNSENEKLQLDLAQYKHAARKTGIVDRDGKILPHLDLFNVDAHKDPNWTAGKRHRKTRAKKHRSQRR
jgi:hypothetical protein